MKYIFILILLLTICDSQAQKFKPSLNLVKGETYYMANTGTSIITQSIKGRINKINLILLLQVAFKVTGIADSIYSMEVTYQNIDMKVHLADTSFEMASSLKDSTGGNKKPDTASTILASMIKKPFNITLSKNGKVLSVENMDKTIAGAFDGFPNISIARKEQIKNQFLQSFGEGALKLSLEAGIAIFPKNPIGKNDKWTINSILQSPAKAYVQTFYQLVDISKDFYQVHGDGTITSGNDEKPAEINGLLMKYDLTGSTISDITINKTTGWISEVKLKQMIEGTLNIMDNIKMPGGMKIPMLFNTDITTTGNKN